MGELVEPSRNRSHVWVRQALAYATRPVEKGHQPVEVVRIEMSHQQSKSKSIQLNLNDIKPGNSKRYSLAYSHRKNQTNFESSALRKPFSAREAMFRKGPLTIKIPATLAQPITP
jgi:hypothetical protein